MSKDVHVIDFGDDWAAMYVDGELWREGHKYEKEDWLIELLEDGGVSITDDYYRPGKWKGTPETPEEAEEMYG